jgi:hypothetical protein
MPKAVKRNWEKEMAAFFKDIRGRWVSAYERKQLNIPDDLNLNDKVECLCWYYICKERPKQFREIIEGMRPASEWKGTVTGGEFLGTESVWRTVERRSVKMVPLKPTWHLIRKKLPVGVFT